MAIYQGTNKVSGLSVNESVPVGTVVSFASNNIPNGWWICDGREVSRTDYKQLFDAIGTTWGDGNGSTTFNIPDYRESVPVGAGENTNASIETHDVYSVGQFKDDQSQGHTHNRNHITNKGAPDSDGGADYSDNSSYGYLTSRESYGWLSSYSENIVTTPVSDSINGIPRTGSTTHGKQVGTNYIIKYSNVLMSEVKVIDDSVIAEDKCYSSQKTVEVIDEKVKEVYSTEEKVIGTWIDGKPIYRKVINEILSNDVDVSNLNIDNLIVGDAFVHYQNNYYMISTVSGISGIIMYFANKTTIKFDAQVAIQCSYIILEYTKTTD